MRHNKNKDMTLIGGFAAINKGVIQDCYSEMKLKGDYPISGFCAKNTGRIATSMFQGVLRKSKKNLRSGLCQQQKGTMEHCFWIAKKDSDKEAEKYTDWEFHALRKEFAAEEEDQPEFVRTILDTWNFEKTWYQDDGKFQLYNVVKELPAYAKVIEITNADELRQMANTINTEKTSAKILYRLMDDIDLGGEQWAPIGPDPEGAFAAMFDGNGFCIKNFKVDSKKHPYAGFFGCTATSAFICNLTIDCVITHEGMYAGALAGQNRGCIHNCIARTQVAVAKYTGGFVGQNDGFITNSCVIGKVYYPILWWLPLGILGLLALLLCLCFIGLGDKEPPQEYFPPVIIDPNAVPTPDDIQPDDTVGEKNATFIMNSEMEVKTNNYAGKIGLKCPSWSNRGFVATVRVTGSDLRKNGVSASEEYYVVYKSGLIKPGYGISVIVLDSLPNGTKLPAGDYTFSVMFEFYDMETNEKSVLNSTCPIEVKIS